MGYQLDVLGLEMGYTPDILGNMMNQWIEDDPVRFSQEDVFLSHNGYLTSAISEKW